MLAVRETISYLTSQNEIIAVIAALIRAILVFLLVILICLGYGEQTKYEERTTDSQPIKRSALPSHYIPSHLLQLNDSNPDSNSDR